MKTFVIISKTYGEHFVYYDDEDHDLVSQYTWVLQKNVNPHKTIFYAKTRLDKHTTCFLHRLVMNVSEKKIRIDHINHNGLDNRKDNLRISNASMNGGNSRSEGYSSHYKGVCWFGRNKSKPWMARIKVNRKGVYLGYFSTQEEAALAYNKAAIKYFGEFAHLNVIL